MSNAAGKLPEPLGRTVRDALAYAESIIDTVRDPFLALDADLRVRSANRSFYETFGVAPSEVIGRFIYDLGDGQWDIPALRTLLEDIVPANTSFEDYEVEHDFEHVGPRTMLLNARRFPPGGEYEMLLLAIEDITDRRRAEQTLHETEERFRLMVEAVKDYAILGLDAEGHVTTWNSGAEFIKGYREDEVVGRHYRCFYTAADAGKPEQQLQKAAEVGRFTDEGWRVRKDGSRFWASVVISALRDQAGGLRGFVKVTRDVTERKRLEDELRRRAEQLAEADRRKDEFIAVLAHELRNPLTSIATAAKVLRLPDAGEDRDWGLGVITRQVAALTRLIEDLLDVSRISNGKVHLRTEALDLAAVIGHAVDSVAASIREWEHELTVSLPPGPMRVDGDATRLEQVFVNLLTNAAKYTTKGGRIRLSAVAEMGDFIVLVRDTGEGIAAEMLPRLFEMFTQVETSTQHSRGGLGIGLALVKDLVELHGGTVTATSEGVGKGSEFAVRLPASGRDTPGVGERN